MKQNKTTEPYHIIIICQTWITSGHSHLSDYTVIELTPTWGHFTTSKAQLYPKSFLPQPTFPLEIWFRKLVKDGSWICHSPIVCWVHVCSSDCVHACLCICRSEHSLVWLLKKLSIFLSPFFSKRARETDINIHMQRHKQTDWLMDTDTGWLTELELASQPWESVLFLLCFKITRLFQCIQFSVLWALDDGTQVLFTNPAPSPAL